MTTKQIPKLSTVASVRPAMLEVTWVDGRSEQIDLTDWIEGGGALLAPLNDPACL